MPPALASLRSPDASPRNSPVKLSVKPCRKVPVAADGPYFITFPLPTIGGQAALPSTVQLYVNGLLKETQQVPPGPFSIPAMPVVTGPGTATIVVQDMLGREQVISSSFYASSDLLKSGLDDYSFSAGKLRDNYGVDSNDYGPSAATGTFRRKRNNHPVLISIDPSWHRRMMR